MRPLHLAAKQNKMAALKTLLLFNADIKAKDIKLNTPLHLAAKAGNLEICEVIIMLRL